jgi:hypothetical protein
VADELSPHNTLQNRRISPRVRYADSMFAHFFSQSQEARHILQELWLATMNLRQVAGFRGGILSIRREFKLKTVDFAE